MSSLHSLLKGGRIKKSRPTSTTASQSTSPRKTNSNRKPSPKKPAQKHHDSDEEDFFQDHLDDRGLVATLATDLSLRDVPQAMAYALSRMFSPVPERASGLSSTRIASVLSRRRDMPPIVTTGHVHAVLQASPAAVEREVAHLEAQGALRRIRVRGRRFGEALIAAAEYERLVKDSEALDEAAKEAFLRFLAENPRAAVVVRGAVGGGQRAEDALIRAGFLTGRGAWGTGGVGDASRDAPRGLRYAAGGASAVSRRRSGSGKLPSVETVARAPSGSVQAVGGPGAVYAAGGGGGGGGAGLARLADSAAESELDYVLAVPGHGFFLKLVSAAVEHLTELLGKSRFGEMPESLLRERWDGGIARDEARLARRARGEWAGVLPGRTRKWKEFYGLRFAWVLEEAMGAGLVEVFETGSVGRGVRKL
ncbi:hypothetical protein SODALDRAFT_334464 [Sodiomyces alkalinus F11]|uniref:Serine-threonine protein kinase 19 n=1 Tax=Sodiomyces alkalinus (strain CBS 110278 / VKM F-3762 / F11) TaxID=1314773 RepID=A0A3N2PS71_SODAK|nr:hypothetical protein SODALDRAFT_334464 [Sodiomyces alkalinus F11]ROT37372.1 hypothetical protein SODALDRAFT_334464 [Sodiomyces alkalinus F11]